MEGVVASRGAMLSRTLSVDRGVDGHRKVDVVGAEAVVRVDVLYRRMEKKSATV